MSDPVESEESGSLSIWITVGSIIACAITGYLWYSTDNTAIAITCLLLQTVLVSLVIWQACDPFADAAQYIGHVLKLPGSVRGATLDAVASSMPELFTGIFFVLLVAFSADSSQLDSATAEMTGEGFKATIATCAGSAVYNMILIPAICAIFISYYRKSRPTIDVEHRVITRDGLWFVAMEVMLITFLVQQNIYWWMGVIFLLSYVAYVMVLYFDARRFQSKMKLVEDAIVGGKTATEAIEELRGQGHTISRDLERRFEIGEEDEDENEEPDTAGVFYGMFDVKLNMLTAWIIIFISTIVAASACYWLVEITTETANKLEIPIFFVAVILAAAASSVPDTFLSIGSAKSGDDDGAVSNAFGSNIFDISICISIPLLVASYMNGWEPIVIEQSTSIVGLQIMLAVLTVVTLGTIWHKLQLTRGKAFFLCGLYGLFILYAVLGSTGLFGKI